MKYWVYLVVLILMSCAALHAQKDSSTLIAFVHVTVIPMHSKKVLEDYTVVVAGNKIVEIKPSKEINLSPNTMRIEASGKFLLPGFADMHIHDQGGKLEGDFLLYLANGVTLVRNMGGSESSIRIKEKVEKGELLAPHYFTTGPKIEAKPFELNVPNIEQMPEIQRNFVKDLIRKNKESVVALGAEKDVFAIIKEHKRLGYEFIKIHDNFPKELYLKLLEEAKKAGIPVVGHAQRKLELKYTTKLKSVSHVEEFLHLFSKEQLANRKGYLELGRQVALTKTTVAPTLLVFDMIHRYSNDAKLEVLLKDRNLKYLPPMYKGLWASDLQPYRSRKWFKTEEGQRVIVEQFEVLKGLTKAMNDAGVPLILGTDVFGFVIPGFSVHQELKLLVDAGLSPYDALKTTTINIANYLGTDKYNGGSIEKGKIADFMLLDKNPLEDIQNTRTIRGVMSKGKWLNRKKLDALLLKVQRKYKQ